MRFSLPIDKVFQQSLSVLTFLKIYMIAELLQRVCEHQQANSFVDPEGVVCTFQILKSLGFGLAGCFSFFRFGHLLRDCNGEGKWDFGYSLHIQWSNRMRLV